MLNSSVFNILWGAIIVTILVTFVLVYGEYQDRQYLKSKGCQVVDKTEPIEHITYMSNGSRSYRTSHLYTFECDDGSVETRRR